MAFGNIFFAGIIWFCALSFFAIALWAFKRKTPMHFWSGSTVQPEEIADIPAYNRANGIMWMAYGASMMLAGVVGLFNIGISAALVMIICLPGIGVLIFAYKRIYKKYRNPSYLGVSSPLGGKTAKWVIIAALSSSFIILIAIGVVFYHGEKEPEVNILSDRVQIRAMYGTRVLFSDIKEITLIRESMNDIGAGSRTNGYRGFGQSLKGHFSSEDSGQILLFVQGKTSPTIRIERISRKDIYISFRNPEMTEQLYFELRDNIPELRFP